MSNVSPYEVGIKDRLEEIKREKEMVNSNMASLNQEEATLCRILNHVATRKPPIYKQKKVKTIGDQIGVSAQEK